MAEASTIPPDILTEDEAAAFLGVKTMTLRVWAARRKGPPRVRIGHTITYRRASLMAWYERQENDPEAARRSVRGQRS